MLQLLVLLLFVSSVPTIFGNFHKDTNPPIQRNGLETKRGILQKVDVSSEKMTLETLRANSNAKTSGETLEGCFGGTGRWLARRLSQGQSQNKKEICCCRYCIENSENWSPRAKNLAEKKFKELLKEKGCDARSIGGSTNDATTEVSLLRSLNAPTKSTGSALGTHQYTTFHKEQPGGREKKTYRSKTSSNWPPRTSTKGSSGCSCDTCFGKSCLLFCDVLKPFCYCLALPCLCLESCCEGSCRPFDDYLSRIYPN